MALAIVLAGGGTGGHIFPAGLPRDARALGPTPLGPIGGTGGQGIDAEGGGDREQTRCSFHAGIFLEAIPVGWRWNRERTLFIRVLTGDA